MDSKKFEDLKYAIFKTFNNISRCIVYDWHDEYFKKQSKECMDSLKKFVKENDINVNELTKNQVLEVGGSYWDDSHTLVLYPLYFWELLEDGCEIDGVNGKWTFEKSRADNDSRLGVLAFGTVKV